MKIGGVTLEYLPENFTPPTPDMVKTKVDTYESVQIFSWGEILPGKLISLNWDLMDKAQFDALDALYRADSNVEWDSDYQGKKFMVNIMKFDGALFNNSDRMRTDCIMEMVIISEVVA